MEPGLEAVAAVAGVAPLAAETRRLYAADWRDYVGWCAGQGRQPLPGGPDTVAAYLTLSSGTHGAGTLSRRAAAIADRHRREGMASPTTDPLVRAALRAVRGSTSRMTAGRASGVPAGRRRPDPAQLVRLAARCPGDLAGLRDRALLLLLAAGLEPEPLLALDREHVQLGHDAVLTLPGAAERVIARGTAWSACPVRALEHWLQGSDTRYGPVFRKVDRWGTVEARRLRPDGLRRILRRRAAPARRTRVAATPA